MLVVQNMDLPLRISSLNPHDLTHGLCQKDISSSAVETLVTGNVITQNKSGTGDVSAASSFKTMACWRP